jgi:hypothetical protein
VNGEKILTAMENRERRGKEETPLEDSKGSICECIYKSYEPGFLAILSYPMMSSPCGAPSSRILDLSKSSSLFRAGHSYKL